VGGGGGAAAIADKDAQRQAQVLQTRWHGDFNWG
jgi:hypothetical protein